ncbi:MAG: TraB/GumN family protein, partial [Planctomycetaceae bacterium]
MNGIFSWRPGFSRAVRRTISLLFVAAVLSNVAQAADKAKKHFLWKVESDKGTVYLLGSVHAAKKELYPLDKVIRTAFDDSDKV